jgi:uncharacterized phiE125 gp8 family phage protein
MAAVLTAPPALLPVDLPDAKAYLRVDHDHENELITALLRAATAAVEAMSGQHLIEQGWSVLLDDWPAGGVICLAIGPVMALDEIRLYSDTGTYAVIDEAHYYLDAASRPARVVLRPDRVWARPGQLANGIEIRLRSGFGPAAEDVPDELRQAIRSLAAHWYENREASSDPMMKTVPMGVSALVSAHRGIGL